MKNASQDSRNGLKSTVSQGDMLHQCSLGNAKRAMKNGSPMQGAGRAYFSTLQFDEAPTASVSMDLSPARGSEMSSKTASPARKHHSVSMRPQLPLFPNRTDSIASVSSFSPLGSSMPVTPTPVASKYDLRMYPHIMEYARIVHWSQREKQKAQARGENVQKWTLPQLPSYQTLAAVASGQATSTGGVDPQAGLLNQHSNTGVATNGGATNVQQIHRFNTSSNQQRFNDDLMLPAQDSSLPASTAPSMCCSPSPPGGSNSSPAQPGGAGDLPILFRGARLSPAIQNQYGSYSSNQNAINDQIAPLLHLSQSNNPADAQAAAVALRLYLQAEQQRRQAMTFDNSYNSGAVTRERGLQRRQQKKILKPLCVEPGPLFADTKSSVYVDEDVETLSPCSSAGEVSASFVPFFNSPDLGEYSTNEVTRQDVQLHTSTAVDSTLPVYFQIPSTPAGSPEFNPSSPPTHLAATSSCATTPNVGSFYQHVSPTAALTGRGLAARISPDAYIPSLASENFAIVASQRLINSPQSQVAVSLAAGDTKFSRAVATCGAGAQQPELNKGLAGMPEKGNVQQILDQLYCSKGAAPPPETSKGPSEQYGNLTCDRDSTPPLLQYQYKQAISSSGPSQVKAASAIAGAGGIPYFADKLQGNIVACLANSGTASVQSVKSHGSLLHPHDCKPCAFFWTKGCQNGQSCKFCHEWHAPKKKKPMKDQRNLMIIARPDGKIEYIRCSLNEALVACNVN